MKSEIFFFISSLGFIILFVFIVVLLYYLIKISRTFSRITNKIENNINNTENFVREIIKLFKENIILQSIFNKNNKNKKGRNNSKK